MFECAAHRPRSGLRRLVAVTVASLMLFTLLPVSVVFAAASVTTPATANVSADTSTGTFVAVPGPAITEGTAGDITPGGNVVLTAPANYTFNTGVMVTVTMSAAAGTCSVTASSPAVVTGTTITTTLGGSPTANPNRCILTFSGIQVRATVSTLPNVGDITISYSGSAAIAGLAGGSSVGTLTEVPGAPLLSFSQQPSSPAVAGQAFTPNQPVVLSKDQFNNVRSGDPITLAIKSGTGTAGALLTCTVNPVATNGSGLATFAGCNIDKSSPVGNPYILRATTGSAVAESTGIAVNPGAATKLAFTTQPARGTPSGSFAVQPVVTIQDAFDNTVTTASASVTLAIGSNPGGGGTSLTCTTNPLTTTNGVASFSACRINNVGVGYTLTANDGGALTDATSGQFDVSDRLVITTQAAGAVGGTNFTTQPVVAVRAGTTNTSIHDQVTQVTLSISGGPAGAALTCTTNPLTVVNGVATFAGCKIDKAGTYTLTASAPGLTSATQSLTVAVGPATKLGFITQPANATVSQPFGTQPVVAVQDAGGNTVTTGTSSTTAIALAIGVNPGGGALTCASGNSRLAVAGVATFTGCTIDKTGTGYTLVATAFGLTAATSSAFNVSAPQAEITLSSTASVITWGSGVSLSVHFGTNGAGKSFQLQGARDGVSWATIATLTTDSAGNASYPYRPATNLYYRVNFAGTPDLQAGLSNTIRVVVRQIALLRPTNSGTVKSIARNTSVTFVTTVRPARPELPAAKVSFLFYRRVGGVWLFVAKRDVYINAVGQAVWTWKFSTRGEWYVRSIANPTPYNANSVWSPLERYSVG